MKPNYQYRGCICNTNYHLYIIIVINAIIIAVILYYSFKIISIACIVIIIPVIIIIITIISFLFPGRCDITFKNYEQLGVFKVKDLSCNGDEPDSPDDIGTTFQLFNKAIPQGEVIMFTFISFHHFHFTTLCDCTAGVSPVGIGKYTPHTYVLGRGMACTKKRLRFN